MHEPIVRPRTIVPLRVPILPADLVAEPELVREITPVELSTLPLRDDSPVLAAVEEFLRDLADRVEEYVVSRIEEELQRLRKAVERMPKVEVPRPVAVTPPEVDPPTAEPTAEPVADQGVECVWASALRNARN